MSVLQMAKVWGQQLTAPSDGLILMALADMSDDEGLNCIPSVPYLAWQTNQRERQVRRILNRLEDGGYITPLGFEIVDARKRISYGLNLTRPGKGNVNGSRTIGTGLEDQTPSEQISGDVGPG